MQIVECALGLKVPAIEAITLKATMNARRGKSCAAAHRNVSSPPTSAARSGLAAEIACIERFHSHAKLARMAGIATIPASGCNTIRFRLDRGENRGLSSAVHRVPAALPQPARDSLVRRLSDGETKREALRCPSATSSAPSTTPLTMTRGDAPPPAPALI